MLLSHGIWRKKQTAIRSERKGLNRVFDVSGTLEQFDVAPLKRFSVIATPLTEHGHHLLRRGGAALLAAGSSRKDGCSVYGREITHGYHSRVLPAVEHLLNGSVGEMKYN